MEKFNVLVADDEIDMYFVTRMVLENMEYKGKVLNVIHCPTGSETIQVLAERDDIGLLLLDIVMETEYAGYRVIDYVRNAKKDKRLPIIIRTGMPGDIPEEYLTLINGISGYHRKSEFTSSFLMDIACSAMESKVCP